MAVVSLLTQVRCSGGDGDNGAAPPSGVTGDVRAIARENALPGTSGWQMGNSSTHNEIVAFTNLESYSAGSNVSIAVSASPAGQFNWKVFRMGGYRGMGGRLYAEGGPVMAPQQPPPTFDSITGLVVCRWSSTFSFTTRNSDGSPWLTGVYLVLITKQDGWQTYAIFILRDDSRHAEVAVQIPTATWHAYNDFGGESLYVTTHGLSGGHARKVSLDRPITIGIGSGTFLFQQQEGVRWLEDAGYDVEYFASSDIGGAVNRLGGHRIYVSIAHDEYVTMAVIDRLLAALGAGTSLAFLTGDTMPWQIRYEDNERTIVGYKEMANEDPIQSQLTTTLFRNPPVNRPENQLTGVMTDGSHIDQPADWVVTNANHWVYANTALSNGSVLSGLVFNEWDSFVSNSVTPAGLTILASSVVPNNITPGSRHESTVYERGQAFVFTAGSIYFTQHVRTQPAVAQMTKNLLARAGATAYQP